MNCISDPEVEIRQMAELANDDLLALVNKTGEHLELSTLLKRLTLEMINPHVISLLTGYFVLECPY